MAVFVSGPGVSTPVASCENVILMSDLQLIVTLVFENEKMCDF